MDKRSKIFVSTLLVLLTLGIIFGIYNNSKLNEEGKLVNVTITDFSLGSRGGPALICQFVYQGHNEIGTGTSSVLQTTWKKLKGFTFPAIYSPRSGLLRVLILPDDFKEFNMPYPDSLAIWVQDHLLDN